MQYLFYQALGVNFSPLKFSVHIWKQFKVPQIIVILQDNKTKFA